MNKQIRNIWIKELTDSLRDRRALLQAILMPVVLGVFYALLNPLLMAGVERRFESAAETSVTVQTIGTENVTAALQTLLLENGVALTEWAGTRTQLESHVESGDIRSALVVPAGFSDDVAGEVSAEIELLLNTGGSAFDIDPATFRVEQLIEGYNQSLVAERLGSRGIDTMLLQPIQIKQTFLTTPEQTAGQQAGFLLPVLIAVVVATGGLFVAIDVTAGEKERGTLESLLLTPASDREIFFGKLMAVFTTTLIPLTLTFLAYGLVTNFLPESLSNGARLPIAVIFGSVFIALPLVFLVNVLVMIVAIRTKSFKDAQSAVTPITLLTMFPAMAAGFFPPDSLMAHIIPAYGTGAVANRLATEGAIQWAPFFFSAVGCVAFGLIGVVIALRLFDRERLLYSM